jgi:hypothetical protein
MPRKQMKKRRAKTATSQRPNPSDVPRLIQERAYQIWESKGRPENSAFNDWIEAKRQLNIDEPI